MYDPLDSAGTPRLRIGGVTYLNSRPLVDPLAELLPEAEIVTDYPSRLASGLAAGRFDVALVSSIEYLRQPGLVLACDACVACHGPVRSVKLYGRVGVERIRTLALDEGSRTAAALVQVLLAERYHLRPELLALPLGASACDTDADAVMLIGDRGMVPPPGRFAFTWDLGQEWVQWTGLPFVFAMWLARPGIFDSAAAEALAAARDLGLARLEAIARSASAGLGLTEADCLGYLRDNLRFHLGPRERQGLERFFELATRQGLAPPGGKIVVFGHSPA